MTTDRDESRRDIKKSPNDEDIAKRDISRRIRDNERESNYNPPREPSERPNPPANPPSKKS